MEPKSNRLHQRMYAICSLLKSILKLFDIVISTSVLKSLQIKRAFCVLIVNVQWANQTNPFLNATFWIWVKRLLLQIINWTVSSWFFFVFVLGLSNGWVLYLAFIIIYTFGQIRELGCATLCPKQFTYNNIRYNSVKLVTCVIKYIKERKICFIFNIV